MPERKRIAYICTHRDCDPPRRTFLDAEPARPPRCNEHGPMKRQVNMPYQRPVVDEPGEPGEPAKPPRKGQRRRPRRPAAA